MTAHTEENKENSSATVQVDYDEEGRKLLARVHLESNAAAGDIASQTTTTTTTITTRGNTKGSWRKLNAKSTLVYKDPRTGGTIHVGNATAAGSLELLDGMGQCRRIVFCQGSSKFDQRPFRDDPNFEYFHFPIAQWKRDMRYYYEDDDDDEGDGDGETCCCKDPACVLQHFQPLFDFLDHELASGNAVLIHCLAGAHRAGTTAIASLMHLTGMNAEQATKTAKRLRPVINPIGDFPRLLQLLEEGLERKRLQHDKQ